MKIIPIHNRVLISRKKNEQKTSGGIYLSNTSQEKRSEGIVKAIGQGVMKKDGTFQPLDVNVGDHVTFSTYAGDEVIVDGEEFVIVSEQDILGVFVKSEQPKKTPKASKTLKAKK